MSATNLAPLFAPKGIALVGASPDPAKLPGRPLEYFARYGFSGGVYPINPKHGAIAGRPCFARIEDVPDPVEAALILLPAGQVAEALEACARRGIGYAITVASGFAEAGGVAEQERIAAICQRGGIRLVGPNCVGLLDPWTGNTATFSTVLRQGIPRAGEIVLVTQSGALGNSLLQSFLTHDIGLRAWISTGNEADLGVLDILEHFIEDESCRVVAIFVEAFRDGERLVPLVRAARRRGKVVIALRAGRSDAGRAASVSHTGKLAGAARIWRDLARQAGLVEVRDLESMVDLLVALEARPALRSDRPEGLGILTVSGGLGVLMSDLAAERGLPVPQFAASTQQVLRSVLPPHLGVANPVDTALFASEDGYARCASAVLEDQRIGTLVLVLTSLAHDYGALRPWLVRLAENARRLGRTLAVTFLSEADQLDASARLQLKRAGVVVLPTATRLIEALAQIARAASTQVSPKPARAFTTRPAVSDPIVEGRVPLPRSTVCRDLREAAAAAAQIGFPVVLKAVSSDIPHKSDVGAVVAGIGDEAALRRAWRAIEDALATKAPGARSSGMLVQEQIESGVELIVGCSVDPEFGRVLMIGAGGVLAEVLDDVRFLATPATADEIAAALGELKIAKILAGARGRPAADVAAACRVIVDFATAFAAAEGVSEAELNPLIVRPAANGAVAVDTLVVPAAETATSPREQQNKEMTA